MPTLQARYWILTIPQHAFMPYLPPEPVSWVRGQLECGEQTSYLHWQVVVYFKRKVARCAITRIFGDGLHAETTRSEAAEAYVWKDDTAIPNTRFELGTRPPKQNSATDWDAIWTLAKHGRHAHLNKQHLTY